jgi:hypothetical protein
VADSDATTGPADEDTQAISITVNPPQPDTAPEITTTILPEGNVGVAYSQPLAANGGNGTLVWSIDSGSLPTGTSLSSAGVVSGTPTATGTSNFTVRVADSDANTDPADEDTQALSIVINPAPPASVTSDIATNRVSGVAPLAVYFDASGTTATTTSRPFHDLNYQWDFGDPDSGIWAVSGKSKNTDKGPLAGHVFETPGTYTVTLTATDITGASDVKTVGITVQDPNSVFSGTNTICVSTSGDFTGAPAGAQTITTSSWDTAVSFLGTGKRVLLRRGDAWNFSGNRKDLLFNGPGILGAFGTGPRPVIHFTNSNTNIGIFRTGTHQTPGQFNDFRFMDLDVQGNGFDRPFAYSEGTMNNITFLRINMEDAGGSWGGSFQHLVLANQGGNPGHTLHSGIAVVETTFDHIVGGQGHNIGGGVFQKSFYMGNKAGSLSTRQ